MTNIMLDMNVHMMQSYIAHRENGELRLITRVAVRYKTRNIRFVIEIWEHAFRGIP